MLRLLGRAKDVKTSCERAYSELTSRSRMRNYTAMKSNALMPNPNQKEQRPDEHRVIKQQNIMFSNKSPKQQSHYSTHTLQNQSPKPLSCKYFTKHQSPSHDGKLACGNLILTCYAIRKTTTTKKTNDDRYDLHDSMTRHMIVLYTRN